MLKGSRKTFFGVKDQYFLVLKKQDYEKSTSEMEKNLVDFIFSDGNKKLDFDEIKNLGKSNPSAASSFWTKWLEDAKRELKDLGYYEQESLDMQKKGVTEIIGWGIITYLYFQFGAFLVFPQGIVVLIVCDLLITLAVIFMPKKSKWGGKEMAGWLAFKKWLKDYSVTKNYPIDSVILWEKYLVYGTVLGISVKALSQLPIKFSEAVQRKFGNIHCFLYWTWRNLVNRF